jgi:hypothetical protein
MYLCGAWPAAAQMVVAVRLRTVSSPRTNSLSRDTLGFDGLELVEEGCEMVETVAVMVA